MRPARSSTLRCFEMAGWLISNGLASSVTVASPVASRARIARRVGSARAAKVRSRRSEACITVEFHKDMVIYSRSTGQSRPCVMLPGSRSVRDAAGQDRHGREAGRAAEHDRRGYLRTLAGLAMM